MAQAAGGRVEAFVREQFRGASLQPPVFRDVPSLRFELGDDLDPWYRWLGEARIFDLPGPLSRRRRRVRQSVARATVVYEEVFTRADAGFFVAFVWPDERPNVDGILAVLPDDSAVERSPGINDWDDRDGDGRSLRLVAACNPRAVDYRLLFRMLAHTDLGMEPSVSAEIFIVNETRPAIFKMYDDRGALVYAPSADRLAPLAAAHGRWLVREVG